MAFEQAIPPSERVQESAFEMRQWMTKMYRFFRLTKSATIAPGSIATLATYTTTVTITGARAGMAVQVGAPAALQSGLIPFAIVTAADTVTLSIYNSTAGALTPTSASWFFRVMP